MLLQSFSDTQKIDAKYFQGYKLAKKKDKDFEKNKSANFFHTAILCRKQSTHQNQISKKN